MLNSLYTGDLSYVHGDRSRAVWLLCCLLAKWGCEADQIERVLRSSELNGDGKFDQDRKGWPWIHGRIDNAIQAGRR
jgi:hypothetical protein